MVLSLRVCVRVVRCRHCSYKDSLIRCTAPTAILESGECLPNVSHLSVAKTMYGKGLG